MIGSHIIPRYYLEQFAEKQKPKAKTGHLWVYPVEGNPRRGTAQSEGRQRGYFAITTASGVSEEWEGKFASMEGKADDVLACVRSPLFVLTDRSRRVLAQYIGLMYARTRFRLQSREWIANLTSRDLQEAARDESFLKQVAALITADLGQLVTTDQVRKTMQAHGPSSLTDASIRTDFVKSILDSQELLTDAILDRPWSLHYAAVNAEFITSDTPVLTALPVNSEFVPGNGLNIPGVLVVFPLNPSTYLAVGKLGSLTHTISSQIANKLNELQVICTTSFAYSKSYLPGIAKMIPARGGKMRFGENSFLMPKDRMPSAKEYIVKFLIEKLLKKQ